MIPTLDTNILIYTIDDREHEKQDAARVLAEAVQSVGGPIALQVCGEFYSVATRQLRKTPWIAAQAARNLMTSFPIFAATAESTSRAFAEAATGRLSFWDANLLSAAELAGCTHILSEDMADGMRLGRIEVVRAFENGKPSTRARGLLQL